MDGNLKSIERGYAAFTVLACILLGMWTGASAEVFSEFAIIEPHERSGGSEAWAISSSGEIVGAALEPDLVRFHGFRLDRKGVYHRIDFPGALSTSARAINARGDIAGKYVDVSGATHGYLWRKNDPAPMAIDVPGANFTQANGINARGDIVGHYRVGNWSHGFLLSGDPAVPGNYARLDAPFSDVTLTTAIAINSRGDIAGQYRTAADPRTHGYVLCDGQFTTIDVPGAEFTSANGMNSEGIIVGPYEVGGVRHAYLWHDGEFTFIDLHGATMTHAAGINSRGDVVGFYIANGVSHGYFLPDLEAGK